MEAAKTMTQLADRFAAVGVTVVHQSDYLSAQVKEHVSEKQAYICLADIVVAEHSIQAQMVTTRTDRKTGDNGNAIISKPMTNPRRLANRSPGLPDGGNEQKTGFIDENQVGDQPLGVFFTSSQSLCFQSSIACSFRSMARLSGF